MECISGNKVSNNPMGFDSRQNECDILMLHKYNLAPTDAKIGLFSDAPLQFSIVRMLACNARDFYLKQKKT